MRSLRAILYVCYVAFPYHGWLYIEKKKKANFSVSNNSCHVKDYTHSAKKMWGLNTSHNSRNNTLAEITLNAKITWYNLR